MTKACFIFDIDGTLADGEHRIHHITQKQPKDWDAYFGELHKDRLIEPLAKVANTLSLCYAIVYVSGRPEEYRVPTEQWLDTIGLPEGPLYLRPFADRRNDDIIKIELLAKLRADGYEPIMAFDDRNRVVAAWRKAGIPCAQVAEGDF